MSPDSRRALLEHPDLDHDPMEALVMARAPRQGRERPLVDADHPAQLPYAMKARDGQVEMTAGIVEPAADPAGELVEIEILAALAVGWAEKPGPGLLVLHHGHAVPVHRNVGSLEPHGPLENFHARDLNRRSLRNAILRSVA